MDDAWGSPWADEPVTTQDLAPIKPNNDVNSHSSEVTQQPIKVVGIQEDSPWGDDSNDFGDWTDNVTKEETNPIGLHTHLDWGADSITKRLDGTPQNEERAQSQHPSLGDSLSALSGNNVSGIEVFNRHKENF